MCPISRRAPGVGVRRRRDRRAGIRAWARAPWPPAERERWRTEDVIALALTAREPAVCPSVQAMSGVRSTWIPLLRVSGTHRPDSDRRFRTRHRYPRYLGVAWRRSAVREAGPRADVGFGVRRVVGSVPPEGELVDGTSADSSPPTAPSRRTLAVPTWHPVVMRTSPRQRLVLALGVTLLMVLLFYASAVSWVAWSVGSFDMSGFDTGQSSPEESNGSPALPAAITVLACLAIVGTTVAWRRAIRQQDRRA